jgi:hypothetical protein
MEDLHLQFEFFYSKEEPTESLQVKLEYEASNQL